SMVRISAPFACTANTVQDFTDLPSRSTVHAPQWLVSQPIWGPVRCSCSRRKWMSSVRGSTSSSTFLPFTVIETWDFVIVLSRGSGAHTRFGAGKRAGQRHACHFGAVSRRSSAVGGRRRDRFGSGHRSFQRRGVDRRAGEDFAGLFGPQRRLR